MVKALRSIILLGGLATSVASSPKTSMEQARGLFSDGQKEAALQMAQQVVSSDENRWGKDNSELIPDLDDLADLYLRAHQFKQGEELRLRVLKIAESAKGNQAALIANALDNLGWYDINMARYAEAGPILQRCLAIRLQIYGPEHSLVAQAWNGLAVWDYDRGHYADAEVEYLKALAIYRQVLGPETTRAANILNNLALLYWDQGDYARAERDFVQALEIRKKLLGPASLRTLTTEHNLGLLAVSLGDYDTAERAFKYVLMGRQARLGPDDPYTLTSASQLGLLYLRTGREEEARPLLKRVAEARERLLGADNPDSARSLFHLAWLDDNLHQPAEAEPLHLQALAIRERLMGPDHPNTAESYFYLGRHYHLIGRLPAARIYYLKALAAQTKSLGEAHEETLKTLENLADLSMDEQHPEEAHAWALRANNSREAQLQRLFAFASESQRIEFLQTLQPFNVDGSLDYSLDTARSVLRLKGAILDSLIQEDRLLKTASDETSKELLANWRKASDQLWQSECAGIIPTKVDSGEHQELVEAEARSRQEITEKMGAQLQEQSLPRVEPSQIAQALPPHSALVEFVLYQQYGHLLQQTSSYGALILTPDGNTQWIRLGESAAIDARIQCYQKYVRAAVKEASLQKVLRNLYDQIWAPLETALPAGISTVYLSPDGALNALSFGVLLTPQDQFLVREHPLIYVASGRDLLDQAGSPASPSRQALIVADPQFDSLGKANDSASHLPPLPGTRLEANQVSAILRQAQIPTQVLLGDQSTETAVQQVSSPWLLHLATHGLYLPEKLSDNPAALRLTNPMQRSVLVLAGGGNTLAAWREGQIPDASTDGLLTAREASQLHLSGTWLVVLSACDTGIGETLSGEGVMGLRRGFSLAGAQHLISTLCPVTDGESANFMDSFYPKALQTGNLEESFISTQRDRLQALRQSKGLRSALRGAGAFILSE